MKKERRLERLTLATLAGLMGVSLLKQQALQIVKLPLLIPRK